VKLEVGTACLKPSNVQRESRRGGVQVANPQVLRKDIRPFRQGVAHWRSRLADATVTAAQRDVIAGEIYTRTRPRLLVQLLSAYF
jgi:hypothetical protein